MFYSRVLPRDFFNEAKLLKCLGQFSLKNGDGELYGFNVIERLTDDGDGFEIELDNGNYGLHVINYRVKIGGVEQYFYSPYNSKSIYPLLFISMKGDPEPVFTEEGEFSIEFLNNCKLIQACEFHELEQE